MKSIRPKQMSSEFLAAFVAAFTLFVALAPGAIAAPKPADEDAAAVKQVVANFEKAFDSHDAAAVGKLFTEDADFTNVQGSTTHSRKELEEHLGPLFSTRLKTVMTKTSVRRVRVLAPNVALVDSDFAFTGFKGPDGADLPARKGLYDWIVSKQSGRWMIEIFHESYIPEAAPAPAPGH